MPVDVILILQPPYAKAIQSVEKCGQILLSPEG